jgi:hypothetical protein
MERAGSSLKTIDDINGWLLSSWVEIQHIFSAIIKAIAIKAAASHQASCGTSHTAHAHK